MTCRQPPRAISATAPAVPGRGSPEQGIAAGGAIAEVRPQCLRCTAMRPGANHDHDHPTRMNLFAVATARSWCIHSSACIVFTESTLELVRGDPEFSQLVMQCLPGDPECAGRGGLIASAPPQFLDDHGALEMLDLLRQSERQPGLFIVAAHLGQPVA